MAIHTTPDSYTKLLIHSNTSDGSTTFVDSSTSGHTISYDGDPHHETDQAKFGATSIRFDGNDDLDVASHADWAFGTGDFTIDYWVYMISATDWGSCLDTYTNATGGFICGFKGTERKLGFYSEPGVGWKYATTALTLNTWYHVAYVRNGNTFRIYLNGVIDEDTTFSGSDNFTAGKLVIGSRESSEFFDGYMDEIRISKGIARWTDDFVPPKRMYGEKSVISAEGGVGIGTNIAREAFHVNSGQRRLYSVTADADGSLFSVNDKNGVSIIEATNDGKVGLGTISPTGSLDVHMTNSSFDPFYGIGQKSDIVSVNNQTRIYSVGIDASGNYSYSTQPDLSAYSKVTIEYTYHSGGGTSGPNFRPGFYRNTAPDAYDDTSDAWTAGSYITTFNVNATAGDRLKTVLEPGTGTIRWSRAEAGSGYGNEVTTATGETTGEWYPWVAAWCDNGDPWQVSYTASFDGPGLVVNDNYIGIGGIPDPADQSEMLTSNKINIIGDVKHIGASTITGNVGIGQTDPDVSMQIDKAGGATLSIGDPALSGNDPGSYGFLKFRGVGDSPTYFAGIEGYRNGYSDNVELRFYTVAGSDNTQKMVIDKNGKVGIGRAPSYNLDVAGNCRITTGLLLDAIADDYNIKAYAQSGNSYWGITDQDGNNSVNIRAYRSDSEPGFYFNGHGMNLTIGGSYSPFTGAHVARLIDDEEYHYGELVQIQGLIQSGKDIVYQVNKTTGSYQRNVLGAFGYIEDYPEFNNAPVSRSSAEDEYMIYVIGDGHILCNGEKGNLAVGDGICSSTTVGQGMKADKMAMCIGIAQATASFIGSETQLVPVQYGLQQFTPWTD